MAGKQAPKNLGVNGRKLWKDVISAYGLRPDELQILEDACRERDLIDRMQDELDQPGTSLIVTGSMKQEVANPLVSELRQHRSTYRALVAALKLPDGPPAQTKPSQARSSKARAAANARWRRGA